MSKSFKILDGAIQLIFKFATTDHLHKRESVKKAEDSQG
jgi:hypothetical protein